MIRFFKVTLRLARVVVLATWKVPPKEAPRRPSNPFHKLASGGMG